jgi:hypothetical protein
MREMGDAVQSQQQHINSTSTAHQQHNKQTYSQTAPDEPYGNTTIEADTVFTYCKNRPNVPLCQLQRAPCAHAGQYEMAKKTRRTSKCASFCMSWHSTGASPNKG